MTASETLQAPTPSQYVGALRLVGDLSDNLVQMLRLHFHADRKTAAPDDLALAAGYTHRSVAHSLYGRLGRRMGELLGFNPNKERVGSLVTFSRPAAFWLWTLRPEFATAIQTLGWVENSHI